MDFAGGLLVCAGVRVLKPQSGGRAAKHKTRATEAVKGAQSVERHVQNAQLRHARHCTERRCELVVRGAKPRHVLSQARVNRKSCMVSQGGVKAKLGVWQPSALLVRLTRRRRPPNWVKELLLTSTLRTDSRPFSWGAMASRGGIRLCAKSFSPRTYLCSSSASATPAPPRLLGPTPPPCIRAARCRSRSMSLKSRSSVCLPLPLRASPATAACRRPPACGTAEDPGSHPRAAPACATLPLHSRRASIVPCLRSLAIPDRLAALSRFFRHRALKQASPCLQSPPASIVGSSNAGERSMAGLRGAIELLAIARSRAAAARAAMASASSSSSPPHPRSRRMGERKEGTTLEARAAERATPCRGKSLRPRDGPDAADRHASQHKKSTRCPRHWHCLVAIVHPTREICRRDGARYSMTLTRYVR